MERSPNKKQILESGSKCCLLSVQVNLRSHEVPIIRLKKMRIYKYNLSYNKNADTRFSRLYLKKKGS